MRARNVRAFTLVELMTVLAIIGLLLAILVPPLSRAREMARRGLCLANVRAIGQGAITYAIGSGGHFPFLGQPAAGFNVIGDAWDWDGVSTKTYGGGGPLANYGSKELSSKLPTSNTRHIWKLVQMGIADPKTFICPSDGEGGEPFAPPSIKSLDPTASSVCDLQNRSQFSFVFQYQGQASSSSDGKTPRDGWNTTTRDDPKMVILADMSPTFRAQNVSAISTSADDHSFEYATAASTTFPEGAKFCTALTNVTNISWNTSTAKAQYALARTDDMQYLNSPNHRGDGQNIIRLDGSGDFASDPWAGAYMDNIWTVQDPDKGYVSGATANDVLYARMVGLYNLPTATFEGTLLYKWVLNKASKDSYPDSFLVP